MKNQAKELCLESHALRQLNESELSSVNGGIVIGIGLAFGVLGGVALLAYGAGYLYGKLTDCNKQ